MTDEEWAAAEAEVDRELAEGRGVTFDTPEAALAWLTDGEDA